MLGRGLLITTAAALLLAAGCSSTASTGAGPPATAGTTSSSPTTVAAPLDLTAELLAPSDLPVGWSIGNSPPAVTTPACLQPLANHVGSDAHASESLIEGATGIPGFIEDLAHFPAGGAAALARINKTITQCGTISVTSKGQTLSGAVATLSIPKIGDQSYAYQILLTYKDFVVGLDVIIARRGDTAMALIYGTTGAPDLAQVQQFATTAINKVV